MGVIGADLICMVKIGQKNLINSFNYNHTWEHFFLHDISHLGTMASNISVSNLAQDDMANHLATNLFKYSSCIFNTEIL